MPIRAKSIIATSKTPSVMVPVLSNTTYLVCDKVSREYSLAQRMQSYIAI